MSLADALTREAGMFYEDLRLSAFLFRILSKMAAAGHTSENRQPLLPRGSQRWQVTGFGVTGPFLKPSYMPV